MYKKKALGNFIFITFCAMLVNILIYYFYGSELALEFLAGYIIELSLSIDNLFLFLIIFSSFNIPYKYQSRVLTYGIIGAIILRLIFISIGVIIIEKFHWMLNIFGVFLCLSSIKILFDASKESDYSNNIFVKLFSYIVPITNSLHNENFFVRKNKVLYATPLFLVLILIETCDIIFALDSIPAIFSITTNPAIIYSSNIFAILGLRGLYFILYKLNNLFKCMKYGVAFILFFTGIKLTILHFNIVIPTLISLLIILIILLFSVLFSLIMD